MSHKTPYLDISLSRFMPVFKNTQITPYIETSRRMADYFIDNLPSDGVVPWYVFNTVLLSSVCLTRPPCRDFNAPLVPPRPADSSAAMIAANGMLLLAQQEHTIHNFTGSAYYTASAIKVRFSLLVPRHFSSNLTSHCACRSSATTRSSRGRRRGRACSRTGRSTTQRRTT